MERDFLKILAYGHALDPVVGAVYLRHLDPAERSPGPTDRRGRRRRRWRRRSRTVAPSAETGPGGRRAADLVESWEDAPEPAAGAS
jgi:hypothetical protein